MLRATRLLFSIRLLFVVLLLCGLSPATFAANADTEKPERWVGAWASAQSSVIPRAGELEERVARFEAEFEGREVPRPAHWSGFRIAPQRIEFWRNRANRLHDRVLYTRNGGGWRAETLYP